ncbi:unnamed protein product [Amoebophrya sp. A120]|nr:unnamed protein product [Amoebophrya sp. A120]|eukprot:GSA120T00021394001.1
MERHQFVNNCSTVPFTLHRECALSSFSIRRNIKTFRAGIETEPRTANLCVGRRCRGLRMGTGAVLLLLESNRESRFE